MHDTLVVLGNCSSTYTCTSRVHDKTGEGEEHVTPIETRRQGRIFITYYEMFAWFACVVLTFARGMAHLYGLVGINDAW